MCFVSRYGGSQHGSFRLLKNDGTERLRKTRTGSTGLYRQGTVSAITGGLNGVVLFQVYCRGKLKRLRNKHIQFCNRIRLNIGNDFKYMLIFNPYSQF